MVGVDFYLARKAKAVSAPNFDQHTVIGVDFYLAGEVKAVFNTFRMRWVCAREGSSSSFRNTKRFDLMFRVLLGNEGTRDTRYERGATG